MKFKKVFLKGGPKRMKYTIPALVFSLIKLTSDIFYNHFGNVQYEETKETEEEPLVHKVTYKKIFADIMSLIQQITPH